MGVFDYLSNDEPAINMGGSGPAGQYAGNTTRSEIYNPQTGKTERTGAYYPEGRDTAGPTLRGGLVDSALNYTGAGTGQGTVGGAVSTAANFSPVSSFLNQSKYGMNDDAKVLYEIMAKNPKLNHMSQAELVELARQPQMDNQLPHAMNPTQLDAHNKKLIAQGLPPVSNQLSTGGSGSQGAAIPNGSTDTGEFKPVTFRTGTGTDGEDITVPESTSFSYDFDPAASAASLFGERSALLNPVFAQQDTRNTESMQGLGRLGLMLSGEGLGAGAGTGMMNPDMYGLNAAQANALAQLSAQSTTDAFGQEAQRAGLELSEYMANEGSKQNMFGNEMALAALRQNYELAQQGYQLQRDQFDYDKSQGDNGWLTGFTSLGSALVGTEGGSDWLTGGLSKGGWFS